MNPGKKQIKLAGSTSHRLPNAGIVGKVPSAEFRDIAQGNNGDYKAGAGWDACTGLGTPNGQSLLQALTS